MSEKHQYEIRTLSSGIRLIHSSVDSQVACCAVMVGAGSRDELPRESGMAHLIEHMLFKGTHKRRPYHIYSRIEDVGGEINAYTTKEETCLHASFLSEHYDRVLELFSDQLFNSTFSEKALITEKKVIFEEIDSYLDTPSDQIFDDFDLQVFAGHPLGHNILGDKKSVRKHSPEDIRRFMSRTYRPENMVIASIGNISMKTLEKIICKHFTDFNNSGDRPPRAGFEGYTPSSNTLNRHTHQVHAMMGNIGYSLHDPRRYSLILLNNILGGPAMSTRLNMSLREKNGMVYSVESNFQSYCDTGLFSIYLGADKTNLEKALSLVDRELDRLRTRRLGVLQMSKARQQLIGQLFLAFDNNEQRMLSMAKNLLVYDRVDDNQTVRKRIEALDADAIIETANEIFDKDRMSLLIYK